MRAAVLTETETLELHDRDRPEPSDDEVLVRIREVGICGSDVHVYEHGQIGDHILDDPLILGHESAGEIAAVGADIDDHEAGDQVTVEPGIPCCRCQYCLDGRYHLCPDMTFMAAPPDDGAFAEYVTWPAEFVHQLPDGVSLREGALCEPLSVGLHAARLANLTVGDSVLVTGAGPIGMLAVEAARVAGATEIIVSDLVRSKLDRVRERGADEVIDVTQRDLVDAVEAFTDGDGVDVVVEASGATPVYPQALDAVAPGGTVVCTGLAQDSAVTLDLVHLSFQEIALQGAIRYSNSYPPAVDLLDDGRVDVEGIVDAEFGLEEVSEAFQRTTDPDVVKVMVTL
jgi:L-iditol 2-dehydrogenase